MNEQGLKLSIYFGDSLTTGARLASDALMDIFARHGLTVAALFRGVEGFGVGRRIHTARFPDISTDLPLLAIATDTRKRIEGVLEDVDGVVNRGLVTLEYARLATDEDVAEAEFPGRPGAAAKLTIFCGRAERAGTRPAYRAIVDLLRRQGAAGATVLLGVDGLYHGRHERARLFARNENVPMAIISVGEAKVLQRVLPLLCEFLPKPVVNLEGIALLKHDGEPREPLPSIPAADGPIPDLWQALRIYTRQTAQFEGRALYTELTRRLRIAGAAGVTTILGEWGFSSDEAPYGDKPGTLASHVPTYTIYIDHPQKVAEVWPIIDEVTAEHGIVTSLFVPAYRERVGEIVHGRLGLAEQVLFPPPEEDGVQRASPPAVCFGAVPQPIEPAADTDEACWLRTLGREVAEFARSRGRRDPIVRITLADGEQFFVASAEARPGGGFVTLYPHPARYTDLVEGIEGNLIVPRALVVPLTSITKIELLAKVPRGTRSLLGFKLPVDR
jgi:PII-like signaling protein